MHSEVVAAQRRGTSTQDLCAGLAYSVAHNYLDRVVSGRPIGRSIMFQGGVANNPSVVAAFQKILETAAKVNADLIVMGTHGRTGVEHVIVGSTAERVVRRSKIPVLTVRSQD